MQRCNRIIQILSKVKIGALGSSLLAVVLTGCTATPKAAESSEELERAFDELELNSAGGRWMSLASKLGVEAEFRLNSRRMPFGCYEIDDLS